MELYPLLQLLVDGFVGSGVVGMECIIVAECASSVSNFAVSVGTSKAGINYYFLKPASVFLFKISYKGVVPLFHRLVQFRPVAANVYFKYCLLVVACAQKSGMGVCRENDGKVADAHKYIVLRFICKKSHVVCLLVFGVV